MSTVALYLSRQGVLISWSTENVLGLLGAQHDLPALRDACRYALTDGQDDSPLPPPAPLTPAAQQMLSDEFG
ncbi:hypothetical protein [Streptomyces aureus]